MTETMPALLASLERNRFFYGKLMDVRQWEREQCYGINARRLLARLGDGSGVLCGLELSMNTKRGLIIDSGVAIDPFGRVIVVPEPVCIAHPDQPTTCLGEPDGAPVKQGQVTICLEYHECLTEPVPAIVVDCDTHERCEPSAVRERYSVCIQRGAPSHGPGLGKACDVIFPDNPKKGFDRRHAVYGVLGGACPHPDDGCVVLGTIAFAPNRKPVVDDVTYRALIPSNRTLFELILCLAERVDDCCGHHEKPPVVHPPRITRMDPAPASAAELPPLSERGMLLSFDREMNTAQLGTPDPWLRAWALVQSQQVATHVVPPRWVRLNLSYRGRVSSAPGAVLESFDLHIPAAADDQRFSTHVVVQARADVASAAITDTLAPPLVLDPDFRGTALTDADLDGLWNNDDPGSTTAALRLVANPMPPMGVTDGVAGGRFHASFGIKPREGNPPRLLNVWPPGGERLAPVDVEHREWLNQFGETPRIEISVDRELDPAGLAVPEKWLRMWQVLDGRKLEEVPLGFAGDIDPAMLPEAAPPTYVFKADLNPVVVRNKPGQYVVVSSADPSATPVGSAAPQLLLDENFVGSSLTPDELSELWATGTVVTAQPVTATGATRHRQLWDGVPGGRIHYVFETNPG
jgi:hypothetical protein